MTTTALDIITDAYEFIGALGTGQQLTPDKSDRALRRLADLMDLWAITPSMPWAKTDYTYTLSGATVTVGPSGNINVTTPPSFNNIKEGGAYVRFSNIDYQVQWVSEDDYNSIRWKSIQGSFRELVAWYQATVPTSTIYFWPVPIGGELHLPLQVDLPAFPDLTTAYSLPEGYRMAIKMTLGEILSIGLIDLPPKLIQQAAAARMLIGRTNWSAPTMDKTEAPQGNKSPYGTQMYSRF